MLDNGTLIEKPLADTSGKRRKRGISLNPQKGYCIAIEYSPNSIEAIVLDTAYNKITEKKTPIDLRTLRQEEKTDVIIKFIEDFKDKLALPKDKCLGIALIDPGIIDIDKRISICCSTLDNWQNVNLAEMIEDKFLLPATLTNTSMAKIRAIDRLEVEGNPNNLMYIEYGEGIGCGLKLEGNYIAGQHCLAGELGHVRVTDKPIPCRCGGMGCLESVAALLAITNNAKSAINENTDSILNSSTNITGHSVLEAASKGDRLASHIVDEAFDYLGRAVAGIVNIVNPEIIIFDNLISKAGEQAVTTLMRSIQKNTLSTHLKNIETRISKINSFIGPLGGGATVLDEALES